MTDGSLVAAPVAAAPSPWAGVWIAEDIELIAQGVRGGSWVDGTLGAVGAGLDGLAFMSDPVGALLQYGIAWLIDHVKPLSQALDWLAGDPAQITAHAQTWRNVSSSLATEADGLARSLRLDVAEWSGSAGAAYRSWASQREQSLRALGQASETMALIIEGAGTLISTVRLMVRDAVATVVSRLTVYAAELLATAGLAAPLVAEQVATLCASWGARIAHWLKSLIASLRKLLTESGRLGQLIETLKRRLTGDPNGPDGKRAEPDGGKPPDVPPRDPQLEAQRIHELGMDPAQGKFRQSEADTAVRIEEELGVKLIRAPDGHPADWLDEAGKSYDAVGNFPSQFFDVQWKQFAYQIERHLSKADVVPVDVSTFTPEQVARVEQLIAEKGLSPRVIVLGRR